MWTLVFINMMLNSQGYMEPTIESYYSYTSLNECFFSRQILLQEIGSIDGYPPINTQAVCIRTSSDR